MQMAAVLEYDTQNSVQLFLEAVPELCHTHMHKHTYYQPWYRTQVAAVLEYSTQNSVEPS